MAGAELDARHNVTGPEDRDQGLTGGSGEVGGDVEDVATEDFFQLADELGPAQQDRVTVKIYDVIDDLDVGVVNETINVKPLHAWPLAQPGHRAQGTRLTVAQ
jgi:hypothetical protein